MEKLRGMLDMADPYDAYAYFALCFICAGCQAVLTPDEGLEGCDDLGCRHIADKAKALGWYVPPPEGPERRMTLDVGYCPACARSRGWIP